ncbi:MAG: FAD/FMN-containing dehydrogenase [Candidatus Azotimanducaceae bacterium]|jgi:FAD/FMN-containing dehydrogenase
MKYESWGRYPKADQTGSQLPAQPDSRVFSQSKPNLPFGRGRSYGDVCLSSKGQLLDTRNMDSFLEFNRETGLMTCQSGVQLGEILDLCMPAGWIIPVSPGTQFVTVGGAIANDVHGKNHHIVGTFGRHLKAFELLRSDGQRLICSPDDNVDLYKATIGGLGLTGLITWAQIQLTKISGNSVSAEHIKFSNLTEYLALSDESSTGYEYTVAWVDCMARNEKLGRGIFSRANDSANYIDEKPSRTLSVPIDIPISMVNPLTIGAFNPLYANKQFTKHKNEILPYRSFFYPLDSILHWNRVYGSAGFLQYQCVIPESERTCMFDILKVVSNSNMGSALAVLKTCGDLESPGLLSFPMKGLSLALDFPFNGLSTLKLFDELDRLVMSAGGRIYSAKDAHTSAQDFQKMYPMWEALERQRDPAFLSDFWSRVTNQTP